MALNAKQADLPRGNIDGVHRHTLAALAKERGIDAMNDEELDCLTMFWHKIPAWPDAPAAHARLRERFVMSTITILSVRMIIDISRLAPFHWDSIISCEMLEWYKFHPSSYARAAELMGKHYGLFTDRIEAVVPERSPEEIAAELEKRLQQYLLPETG